VTVIDKTVVMINEIVPRKIFSGAMFEIIEGILKITRLAIENPIRIPRLLFVVFHPKRKASLIEKTFVVIFLIFF